MPHSRSNFMVYSGIHFKNCPIEIREIWSLLSDEELVAESIYQVTNQNLEFVNIATCNRFDLCIFGDISKQQIIDIFTIVAHKYLEQNQLKKILFKKNQLVDFLQIYFDMSAFKHLVRVTSSLTSLVLGEQQILGQVKSAFHRCIKNNRARKNAIKIFTHNFRIAKKIRHDTDIGKNSLSIAHAALKMIHQVFQSLKEKKILLIGAGEMAKIIGKNFISEGVKNFDIANRTFEKAERLAQELQHTHVISYESALKNIHEYDICLIAINGNHLILPESELKHYKKKRQGQLTVFIDMSVPRKIPAEANDIDNLFVFYVDDLDKIMEQNRELRKMSALAAENIIEEEVLLCEKYFMQNEDLRMLGKMHQWIHSTISYEVERSLYNKARGKDFNAKVIADAATKRIISNLAKKIKSNQKFDIENNNYAETLDFLFEISEQDELQFKKEMTQTNLISFQSKRSLNRS